MKSDQTVISNSPNSNSLNYPKLSTKKHRTVISSFLASSQNCQFAAFSVLPNSASSLFSRKVIEGVFYRCDRRFQKPLITLITNNCWLFSRFIDRSLSSSKRRTPLLYSFSEQYKQDYIFTVYMWSVCITQTRNVIFRLKVIYNWYIALNLKSEDLLRCCIFEI